MWVIIIIVRKNHKWRYMTKQLWVQHFWIRLKLFILPNYPVIFFLYYWFCDLTFHSTLYVLLLLINQGIINPKVRVCSFGTFCIHTVKAMRNCGHITYANVLTIFGYRWNHAIPLLVIPQHKTVPRAFCVCVLHLLIHSSAKWYYSSLIQFLWFSIERFSWLETVSTVFLFHD